MNKKYRKAIIAGNWKMNMTPSAVKGYVDELRAAMPKNKSCEVVLCASAPLLPALGKAVRDFSRISVGAQDVSEFEKGAYTGDVSCDMLTELGARYVIVGHSERRLYHREDDFKVNAKVKAVIRNGMCPIICVGESQFQRERGLTLELIDYQVSAAMSGLSEELAKRCVIAYEPIWAIGTGAVATNEQAQEVCAEIRRMIKKNFGAKAARSISIVYGGSMNPANAQVLLSMPDIDGGLIGGASLCPQDFAKIIAATHQE
ncbi:MAG: triose-phosphate isomerase [Candidatus Heteroscillospira sp.]|jgi:triosephosphate isomerase